MKGSIFPVGRVAAALTFALLAANSWAASAGARELAGIWLPPASDTFPGIRMIEIRRHGADAEGSMTTDWYGPMPLQNLSLDKNRARFVIHNGNPRLPLRNWVATLEAGRLHVVGDIWEQHVDFLAARGSAADAARLAFAVQPLPALRALPDDGLARTPPMGWSSWNRFAEAIDDRTIREIADHIVSSGLRDAGYVYVNIDDGWQGVRGKDGVLGANSRFPDMKGLADYVHVRGLKLGLYSSPGPKSCAGFAGSYEHVEQDARTWAGWGVDYLKYDLCSGEGIFRTAAAVKAAYQAMGAALRATGRPIVFSLCQYGRDHVGQWGRDVGGHVWRTTGDITDDYRAMANIGFDHNGDPADVGPGGWNDPDMLEIGNSAMTEAEYRSHMTLWALSAAPLLMGHDVRTMSPVTLMLLTNPEVIAIDQDPKGLAGRRIRKDGEAEIWSRRLADGSVALGVFNRGAAPATVVLSPTDAGLASFASMREVWARVPQNPAYLTIQLAAHDAMLLRVSGPEPASPPTR